MLPWSLIVLSIDVRYHLPILSSLYSAESSIQVSILEFHHEVACYLAVYNANKLAILQKFKMIKNEVDVDAS